jgi:hypothetical protein
VPAQIRQIVEQVTLEFHDEPEKLLANLTRAMNLYKRSELSEYGFCRVLMEAQGSPSVLERSRNSPASRAGKD